MSIWWLEIITTISTCGKAVSEAINIIPRAWTSKANLSTQSSRVLAGAGGTTCETNMII